VASNSREIQGPIKHREVLSSIIALALAAFYLATTLYIASHRLFWFDELFSIAIARLPNWKNIWPALSHGADSLPPIYYMLVRLFDELFGPHEIGARIPSALAMVAGLLLTFDCARRLTDGLHGLIAFSVLTCSFLPYFGYEARSYAICFMLAALALWLWACTKADSRWSAALFGTVLFLAVTMHYYSVLLMLPYLIWELLCWNRRHVPRVKVFAGVAGVVIPAALLSPVILGYARQFSPVGNLSFHALEKVFGELFLEQGLFLLSIVVVWIVVSENRGKGAYVDAMQSGESVGWLSFCIPLAGFALARVATHAFATRYFIGVLPGVAVAFSCWFWRHFRNARLVSIGTFLLLATWGGATQVARTRHPASFEQTGQQTITAWFLTLEGPIRRDGKQFMLFSNDIIYMNAQYYSTHPEQCALLLDATAGRGAPDAQAQADVLHWEFNLGRYYPLHYWDWNDLRKHADDTALIDPSPAVVDAMKQAGFTPVIRYSRPLTVVYLHLPSS
jgi:hypothetical protein